MSAIGCAGAKNYVVGIDNKSIIYEIQTFKKVRELSTAGKKMVISAYNDYSGLLALGCDTQKVFVFDKGSLV